MTPARLRTAGWLIVAAGVAGAAADYFIESVDADAALNDATALGYRRSLEHGIGVMMGPFGLLLTQWQEWLASPVGHAAMIALGALVGAAFCFRVAWIRDHEQA